MTNNLIIKEMNKDEATLFIQKYHYSKILPRLTKHWLGFYENNKLVGVLTLGWGTQPLQTIKKLFPTEDLVTNDYIEIGKMCFLPGKNNSNFGSQAMSLLVKWIKENTSYSFLYTLADGIMGKCGYVYQACSFVYLGSFKTSVYMDTKTGEKIHPRSAKKLCIENAKFSGKDKIFWLTDDFCKARGIDKINGLMFRYILPLSKKAKKLLKRNGEGQLTYPKDKDLRWEKRIETGKFVAIPKPDFNMDILDLNYQRAKINMEDMF